MERYPYAPQPGKAGQPEWRIRVVFQFACIGGLIAACCASCFATVLSVAANLVGTLDLRVGVFCALASHALAVATWGAVVAAIVGGLGWVICSRRSS